MKILIVDDNTAKAGRLARLLSDNGLDRGCIEVVPSAMQARDRLRSNLYTLVVLDLMLPLREEDEPSIETSLSLLEELAERDIYMKPRLIVGFTAFQERAIEATAAFRNRMWTVVHFDPTTDYWERQFTNVAEYLGRAAAQTPHIEYDVDLCVVTAIQAELDAVHRLPWQWEAPEPLDDSTFVRRGVFVSGERNATVVAACAPRMGSVASALLASKLISAFRPRFLAMPGICAGVRGKVELGDVVVFDPTWEWPSGKLADGENGTYLQPAPHQIALNEMIAARVIQLQADDSCLARIRGSWPGSKPSTALGLVIGPGASGSAVVADSATVDAIRLQHRKLVAVEMEAYGVCAAARMASSPRPSPIVMKAVCDFADETKSDDWQAYAAFASAEAMALFFSRYMEELAGHAGE